MKTTSRCRSTVAAISVALVASVMLSSACTAAKITLQFWEVWGRVANFKEMFEPFNQANPDIQVEVGTSPQGAGQREKLMVSIAAGVPPDIILLVTPMIEYATAGLLTPLNNYVASSNAFRARNWPPGIFDVLSHEGRLYALPGPEGGPWSGLAYNKTLIDQAGVGVPTTLTELRQYHGKLTRYDGDQLTQVGFSPIDAMSGYYFADIWPRVFGFDLYDAKQQTLAIDTPAMADVFSYLTGFFEKVTLRELDAFHGQYGGWGGGMASGKFAFQLNGYWTPGELYSMLQTGFDYGFTWFPSLRGDRFQVVGAWTMAIPRGAKNPDAAFKAMEYLTTTQPAQINLVRNGFLNLCLPTMAALDTSMAPGVRFFIDSVGTAERLNYPENIPIMTDVRGTLSSGVRQVMGREAPLAQVLVNAQNTLNTKLAEAVAK